MKVDFNDDPFQNKKFKKKLHKKIEKFYQAIKKEKKKSLKEIIRSNRCSDDMVFFRLLQASLVKGSGKCQQGFSRSSLPRESNKLYLRAH